MGVGVAMKDSTLSTRWFNCPFSVFLCNKSTWQYVNYPDRVKRRPSASPRRLDTCVSVLFVARLDMRVSQELHSVRDRRMAEDGCLLRAWRGVCVAGI